MVPSNPDRILSGYYRFALILLLAGVCFGLIGTLQYVFPGFMKSSLSFEKIRPMHVSSVVFWILLAAIGSVYHFIIQHTRKPLYSLRLTQIQLLVWVFTVVLIFTMYFTGNFGGREYWEFPPVLALPVLVTWLIFGVNFYKTHKGLHGSPVYVWMWFTGILFFVFTYLESNLWLIPYFADNIVHEMTIQWKSYGSMVGAWNMLIYGSGIYLMARISGNTAYTYSPMAFILYFTGLFNLMFNWGHHIYTLPTQAYVQYVSYAVSMTELFIFGRMVWLWRKSLEQSRKHMHLLAVRFLTLADVWIFLTLLLAIGMSVPAINVYTHGTHTTVAHTMGATIGINTFLLLAFISDYLNEKKDIDIAQNMFVRRGITLAAVSLPVFWLSLIGAGIVKSCWLMDKGNVDFTGMVYQLKPFFWIFFGSGAGLAIGIVMIGGAFINALSSGVKKAGEV